MFSVQLTHKNYWENFVEGYILPVTDKLEPISPHSPLDHIEKKYYPHLRELLKKHQFEGKKGQSFVLTGHHDGKFAQFFFVGVGSMQGAWHQELENVRRAVAAGIQSAKKFGIASCIVALPSEKYFNMTDSELVKQLTILAHMASYEFITFKTDAKKKPWTSELLIATGENIDKVSYAKNLADGNTIGQAINMARSWADLPANHMTPSTLAGEAAAIAKKHGLKSTIFGRDKAIELGMGGFCAVDAGSEQEGKFVVLEYHTATKNAPTIALCGKGVHFDTGGINLKPTSGIRGMKYDMSGAAAVIAVMDIMGHLKPNVNVIGITPLVENMPSGKASRPDDIITCMNGKTVEIRNTDAEGRLILSDALCYAEKFFTPDVILDIATLTGAVQHGLGHYYTGVMSKDEALAQTLVTLGRRTGDRVWELPLDDDFKAANKTDVADIHNDGGGQYHAGTIVGACFLANFVEKSRWAHLDIAGTAHEVVGINYVGSGATGAGIRLLTEFVLNFK